MVKIIPYFYQRLGIKICIVILITLTLTFGIIFFINVRKVSQDLHEQGKEKAALLAETIISSAQTIMITGKADIAGEWMNSLKKVWGIKHLDIIRVDGTEAFTDLSTLEKVNEIRGEPFFQREDRPPVRILKESDPLLLQVIQTMKKVEFYEKGSGGVLFTQLTPLINEPQCRYCHGTDHRIRGILRISISMERIQEEIRGYRSRMILGGLVTLLLISGTLIVFMDFLVVRPLNQIIVGMERFAKGNLSRGVKIRTSDEIGVLGEKFNEMASSLRRSWHALEERESKLKTLLENSSEGLIVMDSDGRVIFTNHVAEAVLDVGSQNLIGKNGMESPALQKVLPKLYGSIGISEKSTIAHLGANLARIQAQEILSEGGQRIGIVITFHDITLENSSQEANSRDLSS